MVTKLTPGERSYEIQNFAQDFLNQVIRGDVTSNEQQGGGYALTSIVRPKHHLGTMTAPIELVGSTKMLIEDIDSGSFENDVPMVLQYLEKAVTTLTSAHRLATSPDSKLPREDKRHVLESLDCALPELRQMVAGIKAPAMK